MSLRDAAVMLEEYVDPRFIIANGTAGEISLVLTNLLLLILGMMLLFGPLAFIFFGSGGGGGEVDHGYGYQQDSYSAYQARSLGPAYDAINVLYMLEDAFRKMEVYDFECQQRAMCEAHEAGASDKYGEVATRLQKIIGSADMASADKSEKEVAEAFGAFREAARRGIQQQDCQVTYAAKCPKGLREFVSLGNKY